MIDQPPRGAGCNQENRPDPAHEQAAAGPPPGYGWGYYGPPPGAPGPWGPYPGGFHGGGMPGWGPMGPGPGHCPDPRGMPGHGPRGGQGHGPAMEQLFEEMAGGSGLAGLGKLLDFEDTDFWKGALVGAAAVLLLTNETVQQSLFKSGVKARDVVEKGLQSLRSQPAAENADEAAKPAETTPAKARSTRSRSKKKESQA